jgi:transcriptional regulator with XRE-family HTH domain
VLLKSKITELCESNGITVRKLAVDLGFTEQSMYRWFRVDTMEIKHLRKIADYFGKEIGYFFAHSKDEIAYKKAIPTIEKLQEKQEEYIYKDKYILLLEEAAKLLKENSECREKLARYEANEGELKQNKAG